ncbi:MAG TPA: hypothetical protein VI819_00090 [Patescibacteria group bacterium]|nr:hypothetical protein [Patescibacteria group bacterium]
MSYCDRPGVYLRGREICINCSPGRRGEVAKIVNQTRIYYLPHTIESVVVIARKIYEQRVAAGDQAFSTVEQETADLVKAEALLKSYISENGKHEVNNEGERTKEICTALEDRRNGNGR